MIPSESSEETAAGRFDWDAPAPLSLAIGSAAAGLLISYLIKAQCAFHGWSDNFQYKHLCYNDMQPLFGVRGISRGLVPYRDVEMEYPPLTGVFMDFAGRILRMLARAGLADNTDPAYFNVSAILLVPFALAVALVLRRIVTARRLLIWSVGTPVILYAFHNWDILAVVAAVWGLYLMEQREDAMAGGALSVGATAKLYPSFLLPGALLARWAAGDRKGTFWMAIGFGVVFVLMNVPVILFSNGPPGYLDDPSWPEYASSVSLREPDTNGWVSIWRFHSDRYPDFGTVWFWIAHHGRILFPTAGGGGCDLPGRECWWDPGNPGYRDFVSLISFGLFAAAAAYFLRRGWLRRDEPQGYPVAAVGLGVIASFLFVSKVHSPQYALWVAPLLALLNVPWRRVLAYLAADVAVFVSGFYYFTVMSSPSPAWKGIFEAAVLARAAALLFLADAARRAVRLEPKGYAPQLAAAAPVSDGSEISSRSG